MRIIPENMQSFAVSEFDGGYWSARLFKKIGEAEKQSCEIKNHT